MSIIKSFSVENGDMFFIEHDTDNFTIIDCCLVDDRREEIVREIIECSKNKGVIRFISTHPDEDHILGLAYLDEILEIRNFYCVENQATKEDETEDFKKYCELRDSSKAFYLKAGCSRKWLNESSEERGSSGITILWPKTENEYFQAELLKAKNGGSPNNISPVLLYELKNGIKAMWMGDLETEFLEKIQGEVDWPRVDVLFAPHHGRDSGKVPGEILKKLDPKTIVIGEAPSEYLNYYQGYNTITQNSAGDIIFECVTDKVHIYVSNTNYQVDFLSREQSQRYKYGGVYIGTLNL